MVDGCPAPGLARAEHVGELPRQIHHPVLPHVAARVDGGLERPVAVGRAAGDLDNQERLRWVIAPVVRVWHDRDVRLRLGIVPERQGALHPYSSAILNPKGQLLGQARDQVCVIRALRLLRYQHPCEKLDSLVLEAPRLDQPIVFGSLERAQIFWPQRLKIDHDRLIIASPPTGSGRTRERGDDSRSELSRRLVPDSTDVGHLHEFPDTAGARRGARARLASAIRTSSAVAPTACSATSAWYTRSAASSIARARSPSAQAVINSAASSPIFFNLRF